VTLTDQEIMARAADPESDLVERKESLGGDSKDRIRQAICAFANDLPDHREPGVIFVGLKDDGTPSGLPVDDQLLRTLSEIRDEGKILPIPSMEVREVALSGRQVAVVVVHPSFDPPMRLDGVCWIRVGPRRAKATPEEEMRLSEKRRGRDLPFEIRPFTSASIDDLNTFYFQESYLPRAFAPEVIQANNRTLLEQLQATKFVGEGGFPTPAGLLVIGREPESHIGGGYIQFLRFQGTEVSDQILDEKRVTGRLEEQVKRIEEILDTHNRTRVFITGAPRERRNSDYPLDALKQLIRNAVTHRTYEGTNAPTRVSWFDDRVEIINPGGPYGQVSIERFGEYGLTDYRNRTIAEAMRVLGFIQRYGVGIKTARDTLAANGSPPLELEPTPTFVRVTVRKRLTTSE